MSLTNAEARFLLSIEKHFDQPDEIVLGPAPIQWTRILSSVDHHYGFLLDFHRGSIRLEKFSINHRYRTNIVLLRYCSSNRHTNPDGTTFDGPHVHIYQEGYDDKIASPIKEIGLQNNNPTLEEVMLKIFEFASITDYPSIQSSLV